MLRKSDTVLTNPINKCPKWFSERSNRLTPRGGECTRPPPQGTLLHLSFGHVRRQQTGCLAGIDHWIILMRRTAQYYKVPIRYKGYRSVFFPSKLPLSVWFLAHFNTWFLGPTWVCLFKWHLERFSRICRTYGRYLTQTDYTTLSVAICCIFAMHAMRPNNNTILILLLLYKVICR